mmetsp:Transcript_744/g.2034  ORF Transcript_744/g.2034 Transcript_744/m.2034 type:complete len:126 (+) Transcript_744:811-1188(+)
MENMVAQAKGHLEHTAMNIEPKEFERTCRNGSKTTVQRQITLPTRILQRMWDKIWTALHSYDNATAAKNRVKEGAQRWEHEEAQESAVLQAQLEELIAEFIDALSQTPELAEPDDMEGIIGRGFR